MGEFTFIPVWVIQDAMTLIMTVVIIMFIVKKEKQPAAFLMEMFCFTVLYAAVYENFATLMGWYGYGRSLIMIFNVPLTVPLVEYLVVYAALRLFNRMDIPVWTRPLLVGISGLLFDFSLDPLAVRQVFASQETTIGRWTWFIASGDVNIFRVPVYNFSGWVLLSGYAAVFFLLGRWWFRRSQYRPVVGYVYPVLAMLASLAVLVSPLSQFLLWLAPVFTKGGAGEWIMLAVHLAVSAGILVFVWRGKMKAGISFKAELPVFVVLVGFHVSNLVFALAQGFFEIIWLQALAGTLQAAMVLWIYGRGRRFANTAQSSP